MAQVFLTISIDEEADRSRIKEVVSEFTGVYMFKHSNGMFFSGDDTTGEALVFQLGKLGYKMTVLH